MLPVYMYEHQYGKRACTMDCRLYSYSLNVKDFGFTFDGKKLMLCNVDDTCRSVPLTNSGVVPPIPLPLPVMNLLFS